jgi:xylulokinase
LREARQPRIRPVDEYVIGVDVGTTATKAVLLDRRLAILAESASREHATTYPPGFLSAAEQDPEDWWKGTAAAIREVLELARAAPGQVAAVGVSSQAPCVVLVDGDGIPLRPALLWMDRRSGGECRARAASDGITRRLTGNAIDPYYAAAKLSWLVENEPDTLRRGSRVLMANGYVAFRLTGVHSIDEGHAGLTLLAGTPEVRWIPELLELWGIPAGWMPPIAHPTTVLGGVTAAAAAATGLREGTPVVAGLVDAVAASLEAGLSDAGDVCDMTGQSTVLNAAVPYEVLARGIGAFTTCAYPIPGLFLLAGTMVATGGILRWFRDQFGAAATTSDLPGTDLHTAIAEALARGGDRFSALDRLAATAPAGSNGLVLLPYFLGERSPIWDTDARGVLLGLSMATTRADVVRAILEGTAYALHHNLEEMRNLGLRFPALKVVGGGSLGRTWNQIKADVTGLPVELPAEARGATVGTALVAAVGAGMVSDVATGVKERYRPRETVSPDPARHALYQEYYRLYRKMYPALVETFRELARVKGGAA